MATFPTLRVLFDIDSTTMPLGAGATYIGVAKDALPFRNISGTLYSDQNCTLYIEQSQDGENWDYSSSFAVTGGTGTGFVVDVLATFARMRIVNGATPQTTLRAFMNGRVN
ncbi:hypothetical protein KsCSTR_18640 [Candidatus Kuenenia stuttgartiensis]|uniref:Uncharacterized protein n=1 Tax=Kuenenia stuttgartiensis TaxID=174633 RepID=A0A6G7GPJ2_KUEST|nr:hypothetical protein [Candidatus Kuenenia stuttgartiensis]QII11243.1 hypothetical protein KsCSTR_18640 [Candidatus Kuenenia stuttgartiensis]